MNKYEQYSFKRKQLQNEGLAPEWLSTAGYQLLTERNYLAPGETPREMYERVAAKASQELGNSVPVPKDYTTWFEAFFDVMWKGWLSPSTPVLTNMGTDKGHPVSCSGTHIPDSIKGFYEARLEMAQLTQRGYGTSTCLDPIRYRGAPISKGGTANGIMQPASGIVDDMDQISQCASRRGSCGLYLNPLHPDFDELADQVLSEDQGWNIGWNISQEYVDLFQKDPEEADRIWKKILRTKLIKGKGYMFFLDKVNNPNVLPEMYVDKGWKVSHSNLCVTGDTRILTKDGYKSIETLAGKAVSCWNGNEWSTTQIDKTGDSSHVQEVVLSNGMSINATDYHKWYILETTSTGKRTKPSRYKEVRTIDLKPGDKMIKFDLEPVTHGTKELKLAYVNGFHSADGTVYKHTNKPRISLHDDKQILIHRFSGYYSTSYTKDGRILNLQYKANVLNDKFFIPDSSYSVQSRLRWLEGYLDGDGTLTNNNGTESIQVVSIEKDFLQGVLLLLQELGIHSRISKVRDASYQKLPANDGSGKLKEYWCKETYRLLIAGSELVKLLELGYKASRVQPTERKYNRACLQFISVTDIIDIDEYAPVYCGNEPSRHKLMFNGVLTGNCSEITLFNDNEHSFTCVLSSINVDKYDEWKDTELIHISTVFLDTVIDDMLAKAKSEEGFERVVKFTEATRAIGLGILGLSSYYQQKMWAFGSLSSIMFNQQFFKDMDAKTLETSKLLATCRGEPEYLKGYGLRFSHRIALPPTMSTATILGGVSQGIEPVYANVFEQSTAGGIVYRINPSLLPLMKERGVYNKETMKRIAENQGSVFAETWLTTEEKEVFRTAFETNQETILLMASHRQEAIDSTRGGQSQSLNLYFKAETPEEDISALHVKAMLDPNIKGLYYVRTLNTESVLDVPEAACLACEG